MSITLDRDTIRSTIRRTLAPKMRKGVLTPKWEHNNTENSFADTIELLPNYIYENYSKNSILSIDFIKWLHRLLYPEGTDIVVCRNGVEHHNVPGEWRLHESTLPGDNHSHSEQMNIESDLIERTDFYNSIQTKKRTDILRYYFDFLRVHPFGDSNLTVISIIYDLECQKYGFESLDILKIRFEDRRFYLYLLYCHENNKDRIGILDFTLKIIEGFHNKKLSPEIQNEMIWSGYSDLLDGFAIEFGIGTPREEQKTQNSIHFDKAKILQIQSEYSEILSIIDSQKNPLTENEKKQALFSLIEERMYRYAVRIRDEYGLKTPDEIKDQFYVIVRDICDYAFWLVQKEGVISQTDIHALHTKLFPKGLWGQCKWPNGRAMRAFFPTGEYRKHREFRIYDGVEYPYMNSEGIHESIALLERFLEDDDVHPLIRAIVYYNKMWSIHPYYNGNGTVFILVIAVFLLQHDYPLPQAFATRIQAMVERRVFWEADNGDMGAMIGEFLGMFG